MDVTVSALTVSGFINLKLIQKFSFKKSHIFLVHTEIIGHASNRLPGPANLPVNLPVSLSSNFFVTSSLLCCVWGLVYSVDPLYLTMNKLGLTKFFHGVTGFTFFLT